MCAVCHAATNDTRALSRTKLRTWSTTPSPMSMAVSVCLRGLDDDDDDDAAPAALAAMPRRSTLLLLLLAALHPLLLQLLLLLLINARGRRRRRSMGGGPRMDCLGRVCVGMYACYWRVNSIQSTESTSDTLLLHTSLLLAARDVQARDRKLGSLCPPSVGSLGPPSSCACAPPPSTTPAARVFFKTRMGAFHSIASLLCPPRRTGRSSLGPVDGGHRNAPTPSWQRPQPLPLHRSIRNTGSGHPGRRAEEERMMSRPLRVIFD